MEIRIDEQFSKAQRRLLPDEYAGLEADIVRTGRAIDPLRVWGDRLVDGHHRYEICQRHGLPFETVAVDFESDAHARIWIRRNQDSRRNLNKHERIENAMVNKADLAEIGRAQMSAGGGDKVSERAGLSTMDKPVENDNNTVISHNTRDIMAAEAGVSPRVIAESEIVMREAPEKWEQSKAGEITIHKAYGEIKKAERADKHRAELEAAPSIETDPWTLTDEQAVVSCAALITDPPYGILKEAWEPSDLETFTREWASRWNDCGAHFIFSFFSQRHMWAGRQWFDESFSNYSFQQLLVWHYANNMEPQSRKGFKQSWEPVFFYRRNDSERLIKINGAEWGNGLHDFDCHDAAVPNPNFNAADRKVHPAQKPLSVMRWLVVNSTMPGETVADPFMGSGTTGIASTQLGRVFHGIEINADIRDLAAKRISAYGRI